MNATAQENLLTEQDEDQSPAELARLMNEKLHRFGSVYEQSALIQAPETKEKLDRLDCDDVVLDPLVKDSFDAALQVIAVDHLVEQMTASLDAHGVPQEKRMSVVAEAFMKVKQVEALGYTLLSEKELTAPPTREQLERGRVHHGNVGQEVMVIFSDRVGRGFMRRHIRFAAPNLYYRLSIWLKDKTNELPEILSSEAYDPELFVNPLDATSSFVKQRSKQRNKVAK